MKQALLIRFRASQLEWLIHDGGKPILEGQGDWPALKEALAGWSGNPDELEAAVLMEGRSTLMTQITVPSKPTRQILDAIPFLVEEQIAGNLDDCFISLGAREGDRLAVVVVDRRVVEEILLAADEAGLAVSFLGVDTQVLQSKGATRLVLEQDVAHVIRSSGVGLSLLASTRNKCWATNCQKKQRALTVWISVRPRGSWQHPSRQVRLSLICNPRERERSSLVC